MKTKLKSLLFMSKGRSKITLKLEKNAYIPGETIQLQCSIDNSNSRKSVHSVSIDFIKHVFGVDPISSQTFHRYFTLSENKYPGI